MPQNVMDEKNKRTTASQKALMAFYKDHDLLISSPAKEKITVLEKELGGVFSCHCFSVDGTPPDKTVIDTFMLGSLEDDYLDIRGIQQKLVF